MEFEGEGGPNIRNRRIRYAGTAAQRAVNGARSARAGYPPLILGTGTATLALVAVAVLEPVTMTVLNERRGVRHKQGSELIRRLEAQRLIIRYKGTRAVSQRSMGPPPSIITLNQEHPAHGALRELLAVIAAQNGYTVPEHAPPPPPPDMMLEPYLGNAGGMRGIALGTDATLFGTVHRTLIMTAVAQLGFVDQTALARFLGVRATYHIIAVVDPLVDDGVLKVENMKGLRTFRLPEAPWTDAFRNLVADIVERDLELAGQNPCP